MSIVKANEHTTSRATRRTIWYRSFFPLQFIRFFIINIRMLVMIQKSHGKKLPKT